MSPVNEFANAKTLDMHLRATERRSTKEETIENGETRKRYSCTRMLNVPNESRNGARWLWVEANAPGTRCVLRNGVFLKVIPSESKHVLGAWKWRGVVGSLRTRSCAERRVRRKDDLKEREETRDEQLSTGLCRQREIHSDHRPATKVYHPRSMKNERTEVISNTAEGKST